MVLTHLIPTLWTETEDIEHLDQVVTMVTCFGISPKIIAVSSFHLLGVIDHVFEYKSDMFLNCI